MSKYKKYIRNSEWSETRIVGKHKGIMNDEWRDNKME